MTFFIFQKNWQLFILFAKLFSRLEKLICCHWENKLIKFMYTLAYLSVASSISMWYTKELLHFMFQLVGSVFLTCISCWTSPWLLKSVLNFEWRHECRWVFQAQGQHKKEESDICRIVIWKLNFIKFSQTCWYSKLQALFRTSLIKHM